MCGQTIKVDYRKLVDRATTEHIGGVIHGRGHNGVHIQMLFHCSGRVRLIMIDSTRVHCTGLQEMKSKTNEIN